MCSWVTFWLIKTEKGGEVPARTALGANSVLSVVNIGFGGKSRPQVGSSTFLLSPRRIFTINFFQVRYATALDVFIILCFFSVFMALVEFALINFVDTLMRNRRRKEAEKEERSRQRLDEAKVLQKLFDSPIKVHSTSLSPGAARPDHVRGADGGRGGLAQRRRDTGTQDFRIFLLGIWIEAQLALLKPACLFQTLF